MYRLILLSIFCLVLYQAKAQKSYDEVETILFADDDKVVDRLDYVLRNEFSQLINTNSNGMIGDFFGISTKDKTLSLAYNIASEKSTVEFNFSGGINDDIAGVFSDNKFKTGIQLGLKYNRLIGGKEINLNFDDVKAIQMEYVDLENKYKLDNLKDDSMKATLAKQISDKKTDSIATRIIIDQLEVEKRNNTPNFKESSLTEAKNKIERLTVEIKAAQESFSYYDNDWAFGKRHNLYEENRKKTLDKFRAFRANGFDLSWISFGAGFSNESYNLFNPALKIDKQFFKENDFIPSVNLSYSHYTNNVKARISSKVRRVTFYTIGGSIKYGNNFGSLSEVEVETVDSIAVNRSVIKTQKAFSGILEKNKVSAQVFFDYYEMGFSKNNLGFHFRGTVDFDEDFPDFSLRGGIIFSAMNDNKSVINFEIFFGLNNIFKVGGEASFLKRNILGVQTTFPLKLK